MIKCSYIQKSRIMLVAGLILFFPTSVFAQIKSQKDLEKIWLEKDKAFNEASSISSKQDFEDLEGGYNAGKCISRDLSYLTEDGTPQFEYHEDELPKHFLTAFYLRFSQNKYLSPKAEKDSQTRDVFGGTYLYETNQVYAHALPLPPFLSSYLYKKILS